MKEVSVMFMVLMLISLPAGFFARVLGGTGYEFACGLVPSGDGGLVSGGYTASWGAGNNDMFIIKHTSIGTTEWARTFGASGHDEAYSVARTADGGYVLCGETGNYGAGNDDFFVLKLSSAGTIEWARTCGGSNYDEAYAVAGTTDGGCIVVGHTNSYGAGDKDMLITKWSSGGGLSWAKTFGGLYLDYACGVIQTQDGGFLITGYTASWGAGSDEMLVVKLASDGSFSWARAIGSSTYDWGYSAVQTADGGYFIVGYTGGFGVQGAAGIIAIKLTSSGALSWARVIDGPGWEEARGVVLAPDGGFLITGYTSSAGTSGSLFLFKLTSTGTYDWARYMGGNGYDIGITPIQFSGGYAVLGYTGSWGAGNYDFLLLSVDGSGNYSGCVLPWNPSLSNITPGNLSVTTGLAACSPGTSSPNPQTGYPSPSLANACSPIGNEEQSGHDRARITCALTSRGPVFLSSGTWPMRIYSSTGQLIRETTLKDGRNEVPLSQGVYIWIAGGIKGVICVQ